MDRTGPPSLVYKESMSWPAHIAWDPAASTTTTMNVSYKTFLNKKIIATIISEHEGKVIYQNMTIALVKPAIQYQCRIVNESAW